MIYLRRHTINTRKSGKGRRGSVIVLVVAVLALLAVIGTVYIVSARSERNAASASNTAVNMELAQKAVDDMAVQVIGEAILDSRGVVGGKFGSGDRAAVTGQFGTHAARFYDMPERNVQVLPNGPAGVPAAPPGPPASVNGPFTAQDDPAMRDQAWLVDSTYRYNSDRPVPNGNPIFDPYLNVYSPPIAGGVQDARYNSLSLLTSAAFNPSTGRYDLPYFNVYASNFPPEKMFSVVPDPARQVPTIPLPTGPFPNPVETNADVDAFIQLLPFSEASGIRYRFGVRIVDASSMANINVGMVDSGSILSDRLGTYHNNYYLDHGRISAPNKFAPLAADGQAALFDARFGGWNYSLEGIGGASDAYIWSYATRQFENTGKLLTPFEIADELELRSYGMLGTLSTARAASSNGSQRGWPNTLGNRNPSSTAIVGNMQRGNYTAYSYSRMLRSAELATGYVPYKLYPAGGGLNFTALENPPGTNVEEIFPPLPAPIAANPDVSVYNTKVNAGQAADRIAMAASNIASLMEGLPGGFASQQEARAFAANYISYIANNWKTDSGVYELVLGPSFVDDQGICVRLYDNDTNSTIRMEYGVGAGGNLAAEQTGKVYLGYAAQPFINEVVEEQLITDPGMSLPLVRTSNDGWAVELYNPYNVDLSLNGYKLRLGTTSASDVDLTGQVIKKRGYFVVFEEGTTIKATNIDAAATQLKVTNVMPNALGAVYLMRPYAARGSATLNAWAAVDQYDISAMWAGVPSAPAGLQIFSERRGNADTDVSKLALESRWRATFETGASKASQGTFAATTLGKMNTPVDTETIVAPLYDRYAEDPTISGGIPTRRVLTNVAEFNKIMRVAHQINDDAAGQPINDGPISAQLEAKKTLSETAFYAAMSYSMESTIHFNFRADLRARQLLDCLAFTDRFSDFSINLGDSNPLYLGLSKLRIPGQINVNTASAEVLNSIPMLSDKPQLIRAILAYRWRTTTEDPRIPAWLPAMGASLNFSNAAGYAGYGIRTMAELAVPVAAAIQAGPAYYDDTLRDKSAPLPTSTTLYSADYFWAGMYNSLTTRSDTFILYGYLEAVKLNPRYGGAFDNADDWYLNSSADVSDDPNSPSAKLLRVGRRRWVAIVDRSEANFNRNDPRFKQPRIVGARELPR